MIVIYTNQFSIIINIFIIIIIHVIMGQILWQEHFL
jgi:hypothetical protein